ncbi:hypothetical protein JOM56_013106 [Amanita muscaria]
MLNPAHFLYPSPIGARGVLAPKSRRRLVLHVPIDLPLSAWGPLGLFRETNKWRECLGLGSMTMVLVSTIATNGWISIVFIIDLTKSLSGAGASVLNLWYFLRAPETIVLIYRSPHEILFKGSRSIHHAEQNGMAENVKKHFDNFPNFAFGPSTF